MTYVKLTPIKKLSREKVMQHCVKVTCKIGLTETNRAGFDLV